MAEQFISESITPTPGSFDGQAMARGEPGLPSSFEWRGTNYKVVELLEAWKTSQRAQGEMYLRRHWFRIAVGDGMEMTIYCERQPKPGKTAKSRWWLYTVSQT